MKHFFFIYQDEIVAEFSIGTTESDYAHIISSIDLFLAETYKHDYWYLSADIKGERVISLDDIDDWKVICVQCCSD